MRKTIPVQVRKRITLLRSEIARLRELYHNKDISEISDEALDSLKHELVEIEQKYPSLITPDSPTQVVSGGVKDGFEKVTHKVRQWSFNDIFSKDELEDFDTRIKKILGIDNPITYFAEEKIDGVKIILEYQKGKLFIAATRGDGKVGENITDNVLTIKSVPKTLTKPVDIIVEGEAYLTIKEFKRINTQREKEGLETYANPRNLVAGSLRQLDTSVTASRRLSVFIYDIAKYTLRPETQEEEMHLLRELGFPVNQNTRLCQTLSDITAFWKEREQKKTTLPYWIDGIVIKVNDVSNQQRLGYTGKAPRFAVAFKFPAEQGTTIIEGIDFQVGRTGVITPVAKLKPLSLAGTTVSRATLHNEDQIKHLDVRIGDTVIVQKAGDIIPEIVSVVKNLRPRGTRSILWPKKVAGCGGDGSIERIEGESMYRCVDRDSSEIQVKRLAHFASKGALDINGLGESTVEQLVEAGLIVNYADIYKLTKDDLLGLEGFKEKSAQNLIDAIAESTDVPLTRLLIALSIDGVGEETAYTIARHFKTTDALRRASVDEIKALHDIGDTLAENIVKWFSNTQKNDTLKKLLQHLTIKPTKEIKNTTHPLYGKRVVITGTIENYGRKELQEKLRAVGAMVSESVSSNTDYVIEGESAGSKIQKAHDLQIPIIKGEDILALING